MRAAPTTRQTTWLATTAALLGVTVLVAALAGIASGSMPWTGPNPATKLLLNGRQLHPAGTQVTLGNFPTGGAVTADGRFLWTVSTGCGYNDIRIVDTATKKVRQTITLPASSGGIALDSAHRLAYVSGLTLSRWQPSRASLEGTSGNCVLVYSWSASTGQARLLRTIPVPPPAGTLPMQTFTATRSNDTTGPTNAWPQKLAVSPNGLHLLVPLNLADRAAVVDLLNGDRVRYVKLGTGTYPFAAAIVPNGHTGIVTNEASGTLSVIDMSTAKVVRTITVGPPLSHPQGIAIDRAGARAYIALSALDQVVVVDLKHWKVERTLSVGRSAGLGTMPVSVAISPGGSRLYVAESGADSIAVIRLPNRNTKPSQNWTTVGHIPTSEDPQVVVTAAAHGTRPKQLLYVAARGVGVGPNVAGPVPTSPDDPIFWAFNYRNPPGDVFAPTTGTTYMAGVIIGRAGLMSLPSDSYVQKLTPSALKQLTPVGKQAAPAGTPLRANGPIKHVFFVVRENRSYDQVLGDLTNGDGSPRGNSLASLTIFGQNVTPNLHSLVTRFPLLDSVYANSEASIQGHYWTSAASVPDYVDRNWVHEYAARGRPNDFGVYAVSYPGNGFLFTQAERQHISYFNYGEGFGGGYPSYDDRNRSAAQQKMEAAIASHSDLGSVLTSGGTYTSDMTIGQELNASKTDPTDQEIFDSSMPAGAPSSASSHIDSFRARFASQLATGTVPMFNYVTMTSDHTRGTQPGFPKPTSMVADSDLALGQLVDTISHSSIWSSSVIFVVEDDSQDGADHVDAHRIPVAVISPYAKQGAVIHSRYDLLSVVRSMELIMGMKPLSLNDAMAAPMYDVFTSVPINAPAVDAIPANIDLLSRNTTASPWAAQSMALPLDKVDTVPQSQLDVILWKSVKGANSTPPPVGPNAEFEKAGEDDD